MDFLNTDNLLHNMDQTCIIWDWNGTLLDDVDAAVNALNRMLSVRGIAPTTRDYYREHFGFPVRPFYAELGVDLEHEDWDRICVDFHRFVEEEPKFLRPDACEALTLAARSGMRQFVLSALREDLLKRDIAAAGIDSFFGALFGVDNLDGATKLDRGHDLVQYLTAASETLPPRIVCVGDTLHDAEVAQALGAQCILVDGGHQTAERLTAAGVPVMSSLVAAVQHIANGT